MRQCRYLRIRLTNLCNLSCPWCHNEGGGRRDGNQGLTIEQLANAVRLLVGLGFDKVKLAGGEPTTREDLPDIIRLLSEVPGIDLSMISNGTLLTRKRLSTYRAAGLARINLSVNTMDPERHRRLLGGRPGSWARSIACIEEMVTLGFAKPKINFVYLGPESEEDLSRLIDAARPYQLTIRLLNVLPLPGESNICDTGTCLTTGDLIDKIAAMNVKEVFTVTDASSLPTLCFRLTSGTNIEIGHHHLGDEAVFEACSSCPVRFYCRESVYAMRLTPDGFIQPCLIRHDNMYDLRPFLSGGVDDITAHDNIAAYFGGL